jgi:hypothetical protein
LTQQAHLAIAVSGKRDLKGDDNIVRRALARAFDVLDAEMPRAPKVLLTGLAVGADTLAVEQVLGRPRWTITAVLPLVRGLYCDDFPDPPGPGSPRKRLDALLAHPKVTVREMAPLTDPATGAPAAAGALRQPSQGSNELRDRHYEQQGLWLADNAALLIAVKPAADLPDLVGGTARIVAYRLGDELDAAAREVIAASQELRATGDRCAGPVWLIDAPRAANSRRRTHPFEILLPQGEDGGRRGFDERLAASLEPARRLGGYRQQVAEG